jgi:hypothetical protein
MNLIGFHTYGWRTEGEPACRVAGFKAGIRQDILCGSHPGVQKKSDNQRGLRSKPSTLATSFFNRLEARQNAREILHRGFFHGWVSLKKFGTDSLPCQHNSNAGKWSHSLGIDCISVDHGLKKPNRFCRKIKKFPGKKHVESSEMPGR